MLDNLDAIITTLTDDGRCRRAVRAQVSRSCIYIQPDIKTEIQRLRSLGHRSRQAPIPARQRSSDASLHRRLEIANDRIRELTEDTSGYAAISPKPSEPTAPAALTSLFDNNRPSREPDQARPPV